MNAEKKDLAKEALEKVLELPAPALLRLAAGTAESEPFESVALFCASGAVVELAVRAVRRGEMTLDEMHETLALNNAVAKALDLVASVTPGPGEATTVTPGPGEATAVISDLQWRDAVRHVSQMRERYLELLGKPGVNATFALNQVIEPLLFRFSGGERTEALYVAMRDVQ